MFANTISRPECSHMASSSVVHHDSGFLPLAVPLTSPRCAAVLLVGNDLVNDRGGSSRLLLRHARHYCATSPQAWRADCSLHRHGNFNDRVGNLAPTHRFHFNSAVHTRYTRVLVVLLPIVGASGVSVLLRKRRANE